MSRMDILSESEIQEINTNSKLVKNTVSSLIVKVRTAQQENRKQKLK
jgi:hypothetical protein